MLTDRLIYAPIVSTVLIKNEVHNLQLHKHHSNSIITTLRIHIV